MANNTTYRSCDNPYYVRAQIIAKSAGSPAYRFGFDESVSLPGNQHGFVRDILDGGKIYVVQMFESTEYRCYAWLDMRPEYGYKDIGSVYGKPNPYKPKFRQRIRTNPELPAMTRPRCLAPVMLVPARPSNRTIRNGD